MYVEKINCFEHDKALYVFTFHCLHYILMFD